MPLSEESRTFVGMPGVSKPQLGTPTQEPRKAARWAVVGFAVGWLLAELVRWVT